MRGYYDEKADLWSAGVILYILLSGRAPFRGTSDEEVLYKVSRGQYAMDAPVWDNVSDQAKDLIKALLQTNPEKRLSASQALESNWIKMHTKERKVDILKDQKIPLNPHTFPRSKSDSVKHFNNGTAVVDAY